MALPTVGNEDGLPPRRLYRISVVAAAAIFLAFGTFAAAAVLDAQVLAGIAFFVMIVGVVTGCVMEVRLFLWARSQAQRENASILDLLMRVRYWIRADISRIRGSR